MSIGLVFGFVYKCYKRWISIITTWIDGQNKRGNEKWFFSSFISVDFVVTLRVQL